jgi:plasmid stability protein
VNRRRGFTKNLAQAAPTGDREVTDSAGDEGPQQFVEMRRKLHQICTKVIFKLTPSAWMAQKKLVKSMVGVTGFEPATPTSRTKRSIKINKNRSLCSSAFWLPAKKGAVGLPPIPAMINMQSMINGGRMASMTIRDIDDRLKARLRIQAAQHGRSMEDEARDILRTALSTERTRRGNLVDSIRARIEPLGGVELEIAPREVMREPVNFDT